METGVIERVCGIRYWVELKTALKTELSSNLSSVQLLFEHQLWRVEDIQEYFLVMREFPNMAPSKTKILYRTLLTVLQIPK